MRYTISQGENYCNNRQLRCVKGSTQRFEFMFLSTCLYDPGNSTHINKLWGFREGISESNSIRIGWKCTLEDYMASAISLYPYAHVNGVNLGAQDPPLFAIVRPNIKYIGEIAILSRNTYSLSVKDLKGGYVGNALSPRGSASMWGKYQLYPHFGGKATAPHSMSFEIISL